MTTSWEHQKQMKLLPWKLYNQFQQNQTEILLVQVLQAGDRRSRDRGDLPGGRGGGPRLRALDHAQPGVPGLLGKLNLRYGHKVRAHEVCQNISPTVR